MSWHGRLAGATLAFDGDQEDVLKMYFDKAPSRVCVSAGAGTGKTTMLVEVYSEAAIRMMEESPEENPFEQILAVTFTIEATRQMKSRVRERLEEHFKSVGLESELAETLRRLESTPWISTLDSLTRELYAHVALDAGLNPIGDVPDEYELDKVHRNVLRKLAEEAATSADLNFFSGVFRGETQEGIPLWEFLIKKGFSIARQYCMNAEEFRLAASETLRKTLYLGECDKKSGPSAEAVSRILGNLGARTNTQPPIDRVKESFQYNLEILETYCRLIREYEKLYNACTKDRSWLDHDDARYWLVRYLKGKIDNTDSSIWIRTHRSKFRHILVDEFQDTSYGQCEILRSLIGPETNILLIGDPKQAIYQWRTADPDIFLQIIESIVKANPDTKKGEKIPFLHAEGFALTELVGNFRSVPELINLYNDIFGKDSAIFGNLDHTGGYNIPHGNLEPKTGVPAKDVSEPRIHPMEDQDPQVISSILEAIRDKTRVIHVRGEENGASIWRPAEVGDCCVLMQSRGKWPELRQELIDRKISYVMIAEKGLFKRPEVSLIIDILDWLANPHNKDSIARILRSPLVGLSDKALRFLAYSDFRLELALESPKRPKWFDEEAAVSIQKLINLRDDLRWMREGKKNEMIEKILGYSHIDKILLSHVDGDQALANIRYLQDIVTSWEEEELISYDELIERLDFFREYGSDTYNMATLADDKERSSVRITTVHSAKGLEFSVVFHLHAKLDLNRQWTATGYRQNIFVENVGKFIVLEQRSPPGRNAMEWENLFRPSTGLSPPFVGTYSEINKKTLAEKWRLFYVALTRAKDHVFFGTAACRSGVCWSAWLHEWHEEHGRDQSVDTHARARNPRPQLETPERLPFESPAYERQLERVKVFRPYSLNASHIYDLIKCPRRYQYSVLQEVAGGPFSVEGKDAGIKVIRFGTRLHRALELLDFSGKTPNQQYHQFMSQLKESDSKEAEAVRKAVEDLRDSSLIADLGLGKKRVKKEYALASTLTVDGLSRPVKMRDKIDLLIENDDDSVVIVDYKTNYPKGNSVSDQFMRTHYKYQLAAYATALRTVHNTRVSEVLILDYDLSDKKWRTQVIDLSKIDLQQDLNRVFPLKVVNGGLEKHVDRRLCDGFCEYRGICRQE